MSEVINGLELNLGNNGGGHTATVNSILNAVTTEGGESLGAMSGRLGEKYDFSNDEIQKLLKRFIAVEETNSQDSNNVLKKSVKFRDKTSLILDSHVFAVRGVSASPKEELKFEGKIYKHSEHPLSRIEPAPALNPKKYGGLIVIGKTYSVYNGQFQNEPYSLGYHQNEIEYGLTFNNETAQRDQESKNISNFSLLYGYKISELKEAIELIGLTINGLPDNDSTIFNTSGRVSAVVSSIASSLGYYWYVNPEDGSINFVDHEEASNKEIPDKVRNPDNEKVQNVSFTESKINKVIVNSLIGDYEEKVRGGGGDAADAADERLTNFYRIDFNRKLFNGGGKIDFIKSFYILWATGNLDDFSFNAFCYWSLFNDKEFRDETFPQMFQPRLDEEELKKINPNRFEAIPWKEIKGTRGQLVDTDTDFGNRGEESTKWYDAKSQFQETIEEEDDNNTVSQVTLKKPSELGIKEFIESYFELLHNSLFVSATYTKERALSMDFDSSNLDISGPFDKKTKILDIEEMSFMAPLLKHFKNGEDLTIEKILILNNLQAKANPEIGDKSRVGFTKDYIYLGLKKRPPINVQKLLFKDKKQEEPLLFKKWLTEENVQMFFEPANLKDIYVGFKDKAHKNIRKAQKLSKSIYEKKAPTTSILGDRNDAQGRIIDVPDDVIRISYRKKSRREVDLEAIGVDITEDGDEESLNEDSVTNTETGEDASADFEYQYYNIINNSTGEQLDTADLNTKQGMIGEIKAFEDNVNSSGSKQSKPQKSSSETIYGLEIPDLNDITLNSLSISLAGGGGVTTTISRSTRDLIPIDDQVIVSDFYKKATNLKSTSPRTTAGQRNLFGV